MRLARLLPLFVALLLVSCFSAQAEGPVDGPQASGGHPQEAVGVRGEIPRPRSQSSFKAEIAERVLPAELELAPQVQQPMAALPKTEGFEGSWPNDWQLLATGGKWWGPNECLAYGGSYDGWPARFNGSGYCSHTNPPACTIPAGYPLDFDSYMVHGPFSTAGATSGGVDFKALIDTENNYDWGGVLAKTGSADCTDFTGYNGPIRSGLWDGGNWIDWSEDLADFSYVGNLLGQANVCIAFLFWSDEIINNYPGFFLDNINIWIDTGPPPPEGCTLSGPTTVVAGGLAPLAVTVEQPPVAIPRRLPEWLQDAREATGRITPSVPEANVVDSAAGAELQPYLPSAIGTSFDGLDYNDNPYGVTPPDPQLAVGPDHVFEMVNVTGRIFNKSGGVVDTFTLRDFFALPSGLWKDADPKIIYDAISGRWFASYLATDLATAGAVYFAVSQGSDPTGAWNVYHCDYQGVFPDYPGIGLTNDKFTVSSNLFDLPAGDWVAEHTFVVEKADMMAGLPAAPDMYTNLSYQPLRFTVRPAHSLSSVSDQYLATFDVTSGLLPATELTVIRVSGTPNAGNVTEATWNVLLTNPDDAPPLPQTAGGGEIDAIFRLLEAIWRDGRLWGSSSAACVPPGDTEARSCAHLIEVNTGIQALLNDIMFGAVGEYFSWPAIRTDSDHNLHVSLTHTNSSIWAGARVAGRLATDPPNTMSGSSLLRAGEVLHDSGRWGDYMGAAVDPSDPCYVWAVGQYAKDTSASGWDWGTYIGRLRYSRCDGDGVPGDTDKCPETYDPDQDDYDGDGVPGTQPPPGATWGGDACDDDDDNDTVLDGDDADPLDEFACQDLDADTCDDCSVLGVADPSQDGTDADSDGACDAGDVCTNDPNDDADSDGICVGSDYVPPMTGDNDNCPTVANENQLNSDTDSHGDACDNCLLADNEDQTNTDADLEAGGASVVGDSLGDECDDDDDNDAFEDDVEAYLGTVPLDNCLNSPPGPGGDAWPLDNNMDTWVTIVPDVYAYRGRINTTGGPPADPMWMQRLDLNADNYITIVPDIYYYRGNINEGCT